MKYIQIISLFFVLTLVSNCKSSEKDTPIEVQKVVQETLVKEKDNTHGIVTKASFVDVKTTMDRLEKIISQKENIHLFTRINHGENSRNAGHKDAADAELIIFGNPKVGLKMLGKDPKAGLDLPLKILAYQAKDGKVYVSYRSVAYFSEIYDLEDCKAQQKMNNAINKFSDIITKSPEDFKAFVEKSKAKTK